MNADMAALAAIVAVASAIVAAAVSVWTARQTRKTEQIAAYRSVHELYDKMVQLKLENPDFLVHARDWDAAKMRCVYTAEDPEHSVWSRYYTFAELCIGFCNAVLQAHECRLMGNQDYEKQWERLVRLVVTEHFPVMSGFLAEGPYLSQYLRDYIGTMESESHWDWRQQHRALSWTARSASPQTGEG